MQLSQLFVSSFNILTCAISESESQKSEVHPLTSFHGGIFFLLDARHCIFSLHWLDILAFLGKQMKLSLMEEMRSF